MLKGKNWNAEDELLEVYSVQQLWNDLKKTDGEYAKLVEQFRRLMDTFPERGESMSKDFPYFTTCDLNPRRYSTGHLLYIESFCVDVHSFPKEDSELRKWRDEIARDGRVEMMFLSADGKTMHILFRFRVSCKNEKKYRLFYRNFTRDFFKQNGIQEDVLSDACDPRRKIVISVDPDAHYRIGSKLVVYEDYLYNEWIEEKKEKVRKQKKQCSEDLSNDTIATIKELLKHKNGGNTPTIGAKELLSRVDSNIEILKSDLLVKGFTLIKAEKVFAGRRFVISHENVVRAYSVIIDGSGKFAVVPPLSIGGTARSFVGVEEIITNYLKDRNK